MEINWNYLIGADSKIDENYDIENRPDPDRDCKKLYDDVVEVYLRHGTILNKSIEITNEENQYKNQYNICNSNWEKQWNNYEKVNAVTKPRDKTLQAPFCTIKAKDAQNGNEWLLSVDYIGPSVNWALRISKLGELTKGDIIEILNACRTIGGHIVWPRGSHLNHKINVSRGGGDSVYDRIDWTLYLIQLCYKYDFKIDKINRIVLEIYPKEIFYRISKLISAICESGSWFEVLGSFEGFCNQFKLKGSFVDEKYEVKWFAKKFPVFPEDYKQFSINNMTAVKQRNLNILINEIFSNGRETYTYDYLKAKFMAKNEEEFKSTLEDCILQGWITDCGGGYYTR